MKKTISTLCLLISFSSSSNLFSQSSPDSQIGGWELQTKTGGITRNMFSRVDHDFILFSSDCKFNSYFSNPLKLSSNYNLWKSKSIRGNSLCHISVDNDFIDGRCFTVSQNSLFIKDEVHNGFTAVYIKKYTEEEIDRFFEKQHTDS
ncbi:hypothetical protein [Maribacter antarcticus]|uniref:hypothetical protein n=1 Tax=Maribacter antarcticus TaxID=505250 RepID=UPI00055BF535|nr:hypothetical protein [Maribacter antarcticus]